MPIKENRLPYSHIYDACIEGFAGQLRSFFYNRRVNVINPSNDGEEIALLQKQEVRNNIEFPFFSFRETSISPNTEGYNSFMLRKFGVPFNSSSGSDLPRNADRTYVTLKLNPVLITVTVRFFGTNKRDMTEFIQRWNDASELNFLSFQIVPYKNQPIDIRVTADPNLTFPDYSDNNDMGKMFIAEASAVIRGYSGTQENTPAIKQINFKTYEVHHPDKDKIEARLMGYRQFTKDEYGDLYLDGINLDADG